ncbi:hypothetical protein ACFQJD_16300 [Haloplanus sp. GCM10025708]|uniref:hypothetical protein n=1 Tax=Haloferacaceae TaxID=1644056 RepID=UPI00361C05A2
MRLPPSAVLPQFLVVASLVLGVRLLLTDDSLTAAATVAAGAGVGWLLVAFAAATLL